MAARKKKVNKAVKKKSARGKKIPAAQGQSDVGYKSPPKEHQFKPGESGNPKGAPIRRINLWPTFCGYMASTDAELKKLDRTKLTQAQQSALKMVKNMKTGKYSGSERLARYVIDRDEGKAVNHVVVEDNNAMSPEKCEEIREILRRNMEASEVFRAERAKKFLDKQKVKGK
ncbi:MAG: hypothetical protein IIB56_18980 [Planctomycetes bacterium]|nr:hypothetical protein [Planctomycetota bacterium]